MNVSRLRRFVPFLVLAALVVVLVAAISPASAATPFSNQFPIQILAVNDFHGNLEPGTLSFTLPDGTRVPVGGAEYLATHIKQLTAQNPRNTVVVSAGDTIGASPLLSALFHDEPTIEAFNDMGVNFNAVGNHEFDEGLNELLRMQRGGCHPVDGCQDGDGFGGADFRYLAANVFYEGTNRTILPAFRVRNFQHGIKIAFIGMTLEGTPSIVTPSGVAGLEFRDEADTVNNLVGQLRRRGIRNIVVLIHEGGFPASGGLYNECPGVSGPIVDIVERTNQEVDLFVTGHTHQAYNCVIDGRVVTSASSFGRALSKIDVVVGRRTGLIQSITANNMLVTRDVAPDSAMTALIAKYNAIAAPLANRIIGQITADILRAANPAGESALGDVIADAQLDATDDPGFGDAVIAFMNPGGIRADLTYAGSAAGEDDGNVTYGESFTVQPFGNSLVTKTMTGEQIKMLLEQQFDNPGVGQNRILQISEGFSYSWSVSAPKGSKVSDVMLNGVPLDMGASYRVTMNSFLADGGDGFSAFRLGTNPLGGAVDTDALEDYFVANSPVAPGPMDRITQLP